MGLSIRAYAQHRGVSHPAVVKAIKSGRIQLEADGSIDPAKADARWQTTTRQTQSGTPPQAASPSSNSPRPPPRPTPSDQASRPPPVSPPPGPDEPKGVDYHKARAVRETYSARLAKLDFEERSGKLISKDVTVNYAASLFPPDAYAMSTAADWWRSIASTIVVSVPRRG